MPSFAGLSKAEIATGIAVPIGFIAIGIVVAVMFLKFKRFSMVKITNGHAEEMNMENPSYRYKTAEQESATAEKAVLEGNV